MECKRTLCGAVFIALCCAQVLAQPQTGLSLTWDQVRARFEANNPTLQAEKINVNEAKAQEITAFLRPNPTLTLNADQIDPFPGGPTHGTFAFFLPIATVDYLHERQHKRELRLE